MVFLLISAEYLVRIMVMDQVIMFVISGSKRSLVWMFFDAIDPSESETRCRICGKLYTYSSRATSSMLRHVKKQHPTDFSLVFAHHRTQIFKIFPGFMPGIPLQLP